MTAEDPMTAVAVGTGRFVELMSEKRKEDEEAAGVLRAGGGYFSRSL